MAWYFKIISKLCLILVLMVCVQYLHSVSKNRQERKIIKRSKDVIFYKKNKDRSGLNFSLDPLLNQYEETTRSHYIEPLCPKSFEINDSSNEWFRATFEQVSPFTKHNVSETDDVRGQEFEDEVVIMTPISNVRDKLDHYFKLVCSLTYPHHKISLVLGEDSSHDQTLYEAQRIAGILMPYFKRIEVFHLLGNQPYSEGNSRHNRNYQFFRRKHLAMVRNQILSKGLKNEKWVLWLDSDIRHIPVDLIQHLMSSKKDVVAANCLYRRNDGSTDTFDRNTWQETSESLKELMGKSPDYLMMEGYGGTKRKFLNDLKFPAVSETKTESQLGDADNTTSGVNFHDVSNVKSEPVKLDGVGGCVLLVRAELHIKGLNFPPYPYHHHIETEGFAKIAKEVYGVQPYGLAKVHVIHW